jgi:hypothetical protein
MTIYYVYAYLRENQTPYYIGKGKNDRAYSAKHNCPVPKDRSRIIILEQNLDEQSALDLEELLIKHYGRKDLGTGILHNKTDGGRSPVLYGEANGMTGKHHTEETLDRIRNSKLGKPRRNDKRIHCTLCATDYSGQAYTKHMVNTHPDHMYILDSIRKYQCKYCDGKFVSGNSLRLHIKNKHISELVVGVRKDPAVGNAI